jgi:hypothetical protein
MKTVAVLLGSLSEKSINEALAKALESWREIACVSTISISAACPSTTTTSGTTHPPP